MIAKFRRDSKDRGEFYLSDYGAVGDGVEDNSPIIEEALCDASERGGTIIIPPGRFVFTQPIRVPGGDDLDSKIVIRGVHRRASILVYRGTESPAICGIGTGNHSHALQIRDLTLEGNNQEFLGAGVEVDEKGNSYSRFENVTFDRWGGTGLVANKTHTILMRDVYFRSCGMAFDLGGPDPASDWINVVQIENVSIGYCSSPDAAARVRCGLSIHWNGGNISSNVSGVVYRYIGSFSFRDLYMENQPPGLPWFRLDRCGAGKIENNSFSNNFSQAPSILLCGRKSDQTTLATIEENWFYNLGHAPIQAGELENGVTQAYPFEVRNSHVMNWDGPIVDFVVAQGSPYVITQDGVTRYYDGSGTEFYCVPPQAAC